MASSILARTIRGIRDTIPSGYVLGRASNSAGPAELISLKSLGQKVVGTGAVAAGGSGVLSLTAGAGISLSGATGNITVSAGITTTTQSGTTYTLQTTDTISMIRFTNSSMITVTLPNNLPVNFQCAMQQAGTGQITLSPASGATLLSAHSYTKSYGRYAIIGVTIDANSGGTAAEYIMTGDGA